MRTNGFRLGALLLCAGLILTVFKGDNSAPKGYLSFDPAQIPPTIKNAKIVNWRGAAGKFPSAAVIDKSERFTKPANGSATPDKVVVEVVKTQAKYPFIRIETRYSFDAQAQAWIAAPPIEYVADQVLVQLKPGADLTNAIANVEGRVVQTHTAGDSTLVLVGLPKPTIDAVPDAIQQLAKYDTEFSIAEPHLIRRGSRTPNDPEFYQQWALQNIQAEAAWDIQTGKASVVVAVVDSGINYNHPDFASRIWQNPDEGDGNFYDDDLNGYVDDIRGYNFAYEDNDPWDDNDFRHGTFVSGLIGAAGNNSTGISGVCWDVRIMPVKVMDSIGLIFGFDEIRGFDYARYEGATIVNASLGGSSSSQSEYDAISRLRSAGVLLVAAAGNDGTDNDFRPVFPASYPHDNIIAVTHSDVNDNLTFDSNYGAQTVDLAAPGDAVYGMAPNNTYRLGSGSSFATPHVSGVAALLKAQKPSRNYASIRSAILNNTDGSSALRGRVATGGRLNAYEALIPRVPLPDALDATSLTWQTGGHRPWFGQTLSSSDGIDAARSGNITHNQFSYLQTTVAGPGVLWFYWRVSSEQDADFLIFSVDGELVEYVSGESDWTEVVIELPAGTHTLNWAYDKDVNISFGEDKGWLDDVLYLRDTTGPSITIESPSGTSLFATDVLLEGTTWDLFGVATLECRVSNANGVGPWQPVSSADGFANWQVQLSNLALGTNLVRLRGIDNLNNISSLNTTYVVLSPLTVNVSGCGSVPAKFAGSTWQQAGKTLTIRATPCAGNLFTHWSGDITSSDATLTFVMQPNVTLQANFVPNLFTPVAGSYQGLFHEGAGVLHESSGLFRMTLTDTGLFNGTLVLDGGTNNFSSRFDPVSGSSTFTVPRFGKSSLQVALQLDFADQITGQIANGAWTADLLADRRGFTSTNPPPFSGMYTLVFPGGTDITTSPEGHGFATATVDSSGRVSLDGRMGDNARILQTIPFSKDGDWPFYTPLYTGSKGSVLGWLKFLSPPGLTNRLTSWIRPSLSTAAYYRNGFSNEFAAIGSAYTIPKGRRIIDCTNALLIVDSPDFGAPITNQLVLTRSNTVQNLGPENVKMKIVLTNGTFSGSLIRPTRTNTFLGVFLQQQNIGLGYVLGSNYIGEVRFEPGP